SRPMLWFGQSILLLLLSPRRKDSYRSSRLVTSTSSSSSLGRATQIVNVNAFRRDNVATNGGDDQDDDQNIIADSATQTPLSFATAGLSPVGSVTSLPSPLLQSILVIASGSAYGAVCSCRALRDAWCAALSDPLLAAKFL
ncbi:hypothetical protein Vretifemale_13697, partial [Volvox reticuliferus]